MNELLADYEKAKQRLQELSETEEYQQNCRHFRQECDRLTGIACYLLERIDRIRQTCEAETVRREYASGCKYLHRGFYTPSPVIEQIVVGPKRGKLLKRLTARANPAFEYGFNAAGQLLWCNQFWDRQVAATEYLIYEENTVCGITVSNLGNLQAVTEEVYENGRLITYSKGQYNPFVDVANCYMFSCEEYTYDDAGLECCRRHHFTPPRQADPSFATILGTELSPHPVYCNDLYFFETKDGKPVLL